MKKQISVTFHFTVDINESPKADNRTDRLMTAVLADEAVLQQCARRNVVDFLESYPHWHECMGIGEWEDVLGTAIASLSEGDRRHYSSAYREGLLYEAVEDVVQCFLATVESVEVREP